MVNILQVVFADVSDFSWKAQPVARGAQVAVAAKLAELQEEGSFRGLGVWRRKWFFMVMFLFWCSNAFK